MQPTFLTIGHITRDLLPDGTTVPGGTVTFAARQALALGEQPAIVTAAPLELQHAAVFQGIEVAGQVSQAATTFENIYRPEGRQQFLREVAPSITAQDVPPDWRNVPTVLLGPVANECADELFSLFQGSLVGLTPQGFMRKWDEQSHLVEPKEWLNAARLLPLVEVLVLSIEDLPSGQRGQALLIQYARLCPLVVCTFNRAGCQVYNNGQIESVPAYPVPEVNPTGAGDVFATAFLLGYKQTGDPIQAARFANAAAALHIARPGQPPSRDEIETLLENKA